MTGAEDAENTPQNEPPVSSIAKDLYDSLKTDEDARRIARGLLQLSDGLRFDASEGKIVIGDTAAKIWLYPEGVGEEDPVYGEFSSQPVEPYAENWVVDGEDALIGLMWEPVGDSDE